MPAYPNTPAGRLTEWAVHYQERGYPAAGRDRDGMPAPLALVHIIWVEGRMVTLHLTDLLEVLAEVAAPTMGWDVVSVPGLPGITVTHVPLPIHHGGPLPPHPWKGVGACGEPMTCQFRWPSDEGGFVQCTAPPDDEIHN
jgi:hypothetical protein